MAFTKFFKDTAAEIGELVTNKPGIYTSVQKLINHLEFEAKEGKKTFLKMFSMRSNSSKLNYSQH